MDHIQIKELEVFANHGVLKQENELGQKFVVSVDLTVDTSKAAESDDIEDAVNYVEVAELIHSETKRNTFQLIRAPCRTFGRADLINISVGEVIVASDR